MKIKNAFLLFLLFVNTGVLFGQENIDTEYDVSLKALDAIRENNIIAFKSLIDDDVLRTIKEETIVHYMNSATEIVKKYDIVAEKEFVLLGTSATNYLNKDINLLSLIFPFPPPTKQEIVSAQQIIFIFSDDMQKGKIIGFKLRDFAGPARKIEEQAKKIPHLGKFNLKVNRIDWFRIWYDKGPVNNDLGNKSGVYALSGNKRMLKSAKADVLLSEILTLINSAKIDSTDINYSFTKTIGSPEYVYIRMTFSNLKYSNLGEFSIFTILTAEKGIDELSKGYIILKHSSTHRYFIEISKNKELWNKLTELAHLNHGNLLEKNP